MAKRGEELEQQDYPERDWSWVGQLTEDRLKGYNDHFAQMRAYHEEKKQQAVGDYELMKKHAEFEKMFLNRQAHVLGELQRRQSLFLLEHGYDPLTTNYVQNSPNWTDRAFQGNAPIDITPPVVQYEGKGAYFVVHNNNGEKQPVIVWPKSYVEEFEAGRNASSYRHEYGHYVDYMLGGEKGYRSTAQDFTQAMHKDAADLVKNSTVNDPKARIYLKASYTKIGRHIEKMDPAKRESFLSERFQRSGIDYSEVKAAVEQHATFSSAEDSHRRYAWLALSMEKRDAQGFINVLEGMHPTGADRILDNIKQERVTVGKKGAVPHFSDLLSASTKNEVRGLGGHSSEYYDEGKGRRQKECFANVCSLQGEGSKFFDASLKRFTPNMYQTYQGILDDHKKTQH